ncbi:MAG: hypothetical protein RLZZ373_850, partial [Pseudomonadota bacterium]
REWCQERDGHCWIATRLPKGEQKIAALLAGPCGGDSTWAHLGEWRRSNTRGMAPDQRHHTKGTAMMCADHHRRYDAHEFDISLGFLGANGSPLVVPHVRKGAA